MDKSGNNYEKLQSRREFFKKTAKSILPILGGVALSTLVSHASNISNDEEYEVGQGCNWACTGGCKGSCGRVCSYGCTNTCSGTCAGACKGSCLGNCKGTCSGSCRGMSY